MSSSRYTTSYLPPHVSPLVSRRIVESRAAAAAAGAAAGEAAAAAAAAVTPHSTNNSSHTPPLSTPHYRYLFLFKLDSYYQFILLELFHLN